MKYRHRFHAGNFADVHKHVTLFALLSALKRKEKGFLYLDTHAGGGGYDLSRPSAEATAGIGRFAPAADAAPELGGYAALLEQCRAALARPQLYPGSPLLAIAALRAQDRAVLIEREAAEARALTGLVERSRKARLGASPRPHVERGDGYARLRGWLPPPERRALTFLDPPYEERREDFLAVLSALGEGLRRFGTGVFAAWYPIKDERTTNAWQLECARSLAAPLLVSELWLYPRDARVALNGSGMLIVNPPWRTLERMQVWLPQLHGCLAVGGEGGSTARMLREWPP
ncbi:MAG: 23S rRNA (adenine(2030)-N(6))-methyltransferase RlmJ [Gammaproteobacteria bacterium]|nr:23S rRNA (adenine(2030)-N(6))-methyltransferase RlmJ [Gammaproteobacteria bacterium]